MDGWLNKINLFLVLVAMSISVAKADEQVYTSFDESTGTLTYYYDDQMSLRPQTEPYDSHADRRFEGYNRRVRKAVIDVSMQEARMTGMYLLFCGFNHDANEYICLDSMTVIEGLENLNTATVKDMRYMFFGCRSLTCLDLSGFNTEKVTKMQSMFRDCQSLTVLDISSFNTSSVEQMNSMFRSCQSLTTLNLSGFNTSSVMYMNSMFFDCQSLTSLDISGFDTGQVIDMNRMFGDCHLLSSLDLSHFNTEQVVDMNRMFNNCYCLQELNISRFNTSGVTKMQRMFSGCKSLTSLDISMFNTAQVENMNYMFEGYESLPLLDLSSFNTANVAKMYYMFYGCRALTTIYCSDDWSSGIVHNHSGMFEGCTNIQGGKGTTYDAAKTDIEYARPDGKDGKKGYFTGKENHGTGIDQRPSTNEALTGPIKLLREGVIYIERNGRVYDLNGRVIR